MAGGVSSGVSTPASHDHGDDRCLLPDIGRRTTGAGPLTDRAGPRRRVAVGVWPVSRPRLAASSCCGRATRGREWEGTSVLDHGKRRGAYRLTVDAEQIDLGNEPPLSVDGETAAWSTAAASRCSGFRGTILTGLCGAALMGGAVFASLDGETNFATVPERVEARCAACWAAIAPPGREHAQERPAAAGRRAQQPAPGHPRHHHEPRSGNREIVRVRPFVRGRRQPVAVGVGTVRQYPGLQSAEDAAGGSRRAGRERQRRRARRRDRRRSLVRHARSRRRPAAREDRRRACRSTTCWRACATPPTGPASVRRAPRCAGRTTERQARLCGRRQCSIPMPAFETRIVPENITLLPKTAAQTTGGNAWNERTITLKKGDSIGNGAARPRRQPERSRRSSPRSARAAATARQGRPEAARAAHAGKRRQAHCSRSASSSPATTASKRWSRCPISANTLSVDVQQHGHRSRAARKEDEEDDGNGVRLYQSIYETALRNQVPRR